MADEKKSTVAKTDKGSKLQRVQKWFKSLPARIARPFKNMWNELKLVTWPSRKELTNNSLIVLVFMVLMSVIIGVLDMGASALINALIG